MKIAYLILAHTNPRLIKKAVECLSCEGVSFFIHIDAKFPLTPFDSIRGKNVFFIEKRMRVHWAEFSQTEAIFLLMRQALAASQNYDYFVLMSGSDFPLRSGRYIRDFLELNQGGEFITMVKLPAPGMPVSRINTLRFPFHAPDSPLHFQRAGENWFGAMRLQKISRRPGALFGAHLVGIVAGGVRIRHRVQAKSSVAGNFF